MKCVIVFFIYFLQYVWGDCEPGYYNASGTCVSQIEGAQPEFHCPDGLYPLNGECLYSIEAKRLMSKLHLEEPSLKITDINETSSGLGRITNVTFIVLAAAAVTSIMVIGIVFAIYFIRKRRNQEEKIDLHELEIL